MFVVGFNTSITLRTHRGTVPALPDLGELFKHNEWNMTTPRLKVPGEPEDGNDAGRGSHFIKGAVVRIFLFLFFGGCKKTGQMRFFFVY